MEKVNGPDKAVSDDRDRVSWWVDSYDGMSRDCGETASEKLGVMRGLGARALMNKQEVCQSLPMGAIIWSL